MHWIRESKKRAAVAGVLGRFAGMAEMGNSVLVPGSSSLLMDSVVDDPTNALPALVVSLEPF